MKRLLSIVTCLAAGSLGGHGIAAELDFYRDVYPFLKANCISCHNKTTTKAGLNMETPELMLKGGDSGPSIVPGKSVDSLLMEASEHSDFIEMPPSKNKTGARPLNNRELARLAQWIDEGAKSSKQEIRKVVWKALSADVEPIYAVTMTEDGRYVACGRANRMFLYDLAERRLVSQIGDGKDGVAHRSLVNSLAFSPDGTRLVSGSYREVKIWKNHARPASPRAGDSALGAVASAPFPDGNRIVVADKAGALIVMEAASGKVLKKIEKAITPGVPHLVVSPDGLKIAALSSPWTLGVWNVADGKLVAQQKTPQPDLDVKSRAATDGHAAKVKALGEADAALKKATAARTQAIAEMDKLNAAPPKVAAEEAKKLRDAAKVKMDAMTKAEADAKAKHNAARVAADEAKKAADAAVAAANQARATKTTALGWSSDGKIILTADEGKRLLAWTLPASGAAFSAPRNLAGANGPIVTIVTAPGGQILTGGIDSKVRLWNLADGKVVKEITAASVDVAISPDGKWIATGDVNGVVRIWDAATGKQALDLRGSPEIDAKVAALEKTIDREKLEQAYQKAHVAEIEARDKGLADLLKKAQDAVVSMNKKIPDAEKAIPPLTEARVAAEKKVAEAEAAKKSPPEGKTEAALESELEKAKVALLAAETKENDAVAALAAFRSNIVDAQANQKKITDSQAVNAKKIAASKTAEADAKKRETDANTALTAARKELTALVGKTFSVAFSADSAQLAASFVDGSVHTWSTLSGKALEKATGPVAQSDTLLPRADGSFLSCRVDGGVLLTAGAPQWKLERALGGEAHPDLFADRVNAVAFSPDGKLFAAGSGEPSRSGDIAIFDVATGKATATWKECHTDSVISLEFSPDGKQLASGGADKIARITDVATGERVHLFEGHTHYVNDVSFRSDGRMLATAGADGVVNSWDLTIGERKKKIEGWTKEVTSLQYIGASDRIVTSAGDNLVRIINDAGSQVRAISELPDFMQSAASTADGKLIVAGGEDSYLRVWNGTDGKEIVAFGMQ